MKLILATLFAFLALSMGFRSRLDNNMFMQYNDGRCNDPDGACNYSKGMCEAVLTGNENYCDGCVKPK